MSNEETSRFSITLKGGPGYDAPWIVLRAETAEEAVQLLKDVREADLDVAVRVAASSFQTVATGSPEKAATAVLGFNPANDTPPPPGPAPALSGPYTPGPGAAPGNGVGNYPSGQQLPQALQPVCGTCNGPTVFKVDTKNNPPQWKGWFCATAPRGARHDVTWVK